MRTQNVANSGANRSERLWIRAW